MDGRLGHCFALMALLRSAAVSAAATAPAPQPWTPDRVREFVLHVEAEMDRLQSQQAERHHPIAGTCHGKKIDFAFESAPAIDRVGRFATGNALACYLGNYLGCFDGEWLASELSGRYTPPGRPFKRSKVTIVEQTAERVVADVGEVLYTEVFHGVPMAFQGEDEFSRPFTDAEIAAVKDWSRYTIVKGKDGVWRISDRKTSYGWFCDFLNKRPH